MNRSSTFIHHIGISADVFLMCLVLLSPSLKQYTDFMLWCYNWLWLQSSAFQEGKTRPFNLFLKTPEYQEGFSQLSESDLSQNEQEHIFSVVEKFIYRMYSMSLCNTVNDTRYDIFTTTYQVKDVNEPFSKKFKNFDTTNLPPCKAELHQQLVRMQYIGTL